MKITKQVLKQMIMEELQQEADQDNSKYDFVDKTAAIKGDTVTFSADITTSLPPEIFRICLLKYATYLENDETLKSSEEFKAVGKKMLTAVSNMLGDVKKLMP